MHEASPPANRSVSRAVLLDHEMASTLQEKYDVFLNTRGEDTGNNFASHLYAAFSRCKIDTYINYRLERGDEISTDPLRGIKESKLSVVIFSTNYASSPWCLDELVHILECKKEYMQFVVPIFYKVDPSTVRKQTGSFGAAFAEHEIRFGGEMGRVQLWREALKEAANLSGWDLAVTKSESKLVDVIVQDILKKLRGTSPSSDAKGLAGIDKYDGKSRVADVTIHKLLRVNYDGLDATEKDIITDIACFFKGEVEKKLNGLDQFPDEFLQRLGSILLNKSQKETYMSCQEIASSSSSSSEKYDVFVSFRGKDTRDNITSHLSAALSRNQINTFTDKRLKRGDAISPALQRAIEESKLSVIIFSKNYASSSWCLDELVHILKCKKLNLQFVLPIFFKIDPSTVRKQTGCFEAAFVEHKTQVREIRRVQQWREALREAANLLGWDSAVTKPESELVDDVVQDILTKLSSISPKNDPKGLVGINERVETILPLLSIDSVDVRVLGLWGMGGIGKTILAKAIFNRLLRKFESGCFLTNVREESYKFGLIYLRKKLLSTLLGQEISSTMDASNTYNMERLRRKRVIVILDDVSSLEQLKTLVGDRDWFALGSRIIVTTRDIRALQANDVHLYEVKELDYFKSLELFLWNAFEEKPVDPSDFIELSRKVVNYAKGVPLALRVLGSRLCSKSKKEWEKELIKLRMIPNLTIHNLLRTSYDGLDTTEKDIFLDIACFFRGHNRYLLENILNGCDLFADLGIPNLIRKSLITVTDHNKLWMHDLLQEMGWEIVRQQSRELGKRSRLWIAKDVLRVLKTNTGTGAIEGLFLDMSLIQDTDLDPTVFSKMHNLKLLKIYDSNNYKNVCKLRLSKGLLSLPNTLRYLHWNRYPLNSLPAEFSLENVVVLKMPHSQVDWLSNQDQSLGRLKHIELSPSDHLNQFPDLSQAMNLERIVLKGYKSLVEVPSYLQNFERLTNINFTGNSNLKTLSAIPYSVEYLTLDETGIEELPSSIESLDNLIYLSLRNCERLTSISCIAQKLPSLMYLYLDGCSSLHEFPKPPMNIRAQTLNRTATDQVPSPSQVDDFKSISLLNCVELTEESRDNIIAYSQLRTMCVARECLKPGRVNDHSQLYVCCPGNRIPGWMSHQSDGNSISIKLSPGWLSNNFLGFGLSVVAEFENHKNHGAFVFKSKSKFKGIDDQCCTFEPPLVGWIASEFWDRLDDPVRVPGVDSDHVFLWYAYNTNSFLKSDNKDLSTDLRTATEASFEFHPFDIYRVRNALTTCFVKRCGVSLIYAQGSPSISMDEESETPHHRLKRRRDEKK